jgi:hypothetical protein
MTPDTRGLLEDLQRRVSELERRRESPPSAGQGGPELWVVTAGSILPPTGIEGAARITVDYSTLTIALVEDLPSPGPLPSGVFVARNLISQQYALGLNANPAPVRHDIWVGMVLVVHSSVRVPVTGDTDSTQRFLLPGMAS